MDGGPGVGGPVDQRLSTGPRSLEGNLLGEVHGERGCCRLAAISASRSKVTTQKLGKDGIPSEPS